MCTCFSRWGSCDSARLVGRIPWNWMPQSAGLFQELFSIPSRLSQLSVRCSPDNDTADIYYECLIQESWATAKMTARFALYNVRWKFSRVPEYSHGYFCRNFLTGFCSDRSCEKKCVQNLKFVALPIFEIIRVLKNLDSPWIRPRSLFSQIFHGLLFGWTLWMHGPNLQAVPEIITIAVFGLGLRTPNLAL